MKKSVREHIAEIAGAGGITPEIRAKILASDPEQDWVREHKYLPKIDVDGKKQLVRYVPIEICRDILDVLWPGWSFEILREAVMLNSVMCTGRLFLPEANGVVRRMDGTGAAALQTDNGAGALDFDKLKSSSVEIAIPKAATQAEKNACDRLGRVFGFHLNKSAFDGAVDHLERENLPISERIEDLTADGTPPEAFGRLYASLSESDRAVHTPAIIEAAATANQLLAIYNTMSKAEKQTYGAALNAQKMAIKTKGGIQ